MNGKLLLGLVWIGVAVGCLSFVIFRFVFNEAVDSSVRGAVSGAIGGLLGGLWVRKQKSKGTQG
jgi:hypothetical protein